ncbi:GNAT family N-acetyltransferase [Fusobacterium ulcerans]|uniref:GNAT family N-acetyltransferase n=1 Tax=Fusobacterium ulcerans TaxID=861 RepID=UPI001D0B08D5|nr:GNAT family N-acetyltransferase [Fusobacterium ulcerans]MCB8566619.1 GNAT family N-acetyltransferase [Fusobacterium ulcerans]MCB8650239.1 GNAT family N-acetyltransferase [Fusobacterium ulcerans]
MRAVFGEKGDFESWIELVKLVSGNFPGLDLKCYKDVLIEKIEKKETLVVKDGEKVVGALAFSYEEKELSFLAVHPEYRQENIGTELVKKFASLFEVGTKLSVITYRDGDIKGEGARKLYKKAGFSEGDLITVFDYPCQEFIYVVK